MNPTHFLKPGFGAWDCTRYPIGGKFWRNGKEPLPVVLDSQGRFGYGCNAIVKTEDGRKLAVQMGHLKSAQPEEEEGEEQED